MSPTVEREQHKHEVLMLAAALGLAMDEVERQVGRELCTIVKRVAMQKCLSETVMTGRGIRGYDAGDFRTRSIFNQAWKALDGMRLRLCVMGLYGHR
jgi:hypothetical protein